MKVFMSWSGARSKATAELLCDWTKCVIQALRPWISTRGIDRGALWFSEINNELKDTTVGIVCLTQENKSKPWILFEAGALARGLSTNRVCTFLVDLTPTDLQDPLAQFNHTLPTRESLWSLVVTLNSSLEINALDERILIQVFDTYWPQFEQKFLALLEKFPQETIVEARKPETVLDEILETTRGLSHRLRSIEANVDRKAGLKISHNSRSLKDAKQLVSTVLDHGGSIGHVIQELVSQGYSQEMINEVAGTHTFSIKHSMGSDTLKST